jgi:hypothetical protein
MTEACYSGSGTARREFQARMRNHQNAFGAYGGTETSMSQQRATNT